MKLTGGGKKRRMRIEVRGAEESVIDGKMMELREREHEEKREKLKKEEVKEQRLKLKQWNWKEGGKKTKERDVKRW